MKLALALVSTLTLALTFLSGCARSIEALSTLAPEAQVAFAQREVSFRAVGMLGIDPQTGDIYCILCYVTYDRNLGQGPMPQPKPPQ